jgi:hypothetical protein
MKKINSLLFASGLPYLLTLLWGAFFYFSNTLINNETNEPLIKYHLSEIPSFAADEVLYTNRIKEDELERYEGQLQKRRMRLSVVNLSKSVLVDKLDIVIRFRYEMSRYSPQRFFGQEIIAISPAGIDSTGNYINDESMTFEEGSLRQSVFNINNFQPGNTYNLEFYTIYHKDIKESPVPYVYSSTAIKFVKADFRTWLVEHQLVINIVLLVSLFVAALIYTWWWLKSGNDTKKIPYT